MSTFRQNFVRDANERIYQAWLGKHPEIAPCEANRGIIFEYIADDDKNISEADLDLEGAIRTRSRNGFPTTRNQNGI
jgi:hypothetical protein